jgi:hypothetical protein
MIDPYFMHGFQQPLPFLTLLHRVLLKSGREGGQDNFLRKAIEVLDDQIADAIVEHPALLTHYQLITEPVTFFKGELVCVVMLDFPNVQSKLRP